MPENSVLPETPAGTTPPPNQNVLNVVAQPSAQPTPNLATLLDHPAPQKRGFFARLFGGKTLLQKRAAAEAKTIENVGEKHMVGLTKEEEIRIKEAEKMYREGMTTIKDLIAPASLEVNFDHMKIGSMFVRSFFVYAYPRYIDANWLSPIINLDATLDG